MANPMIHKTRKGGEVEPIPPNMEWLDPITNVYGRRWHRYVRTGDELFYLSKAITTDMKLVRQNFYLIHCNYFCVTSLMEYIPAEIAVLEFNFAEGVKKIYHTIIDPGEIPLGYAADAKLHCDEVHGIDAPPTIIGEKNMMNVIKAVKSMLKDNFCSDSKNPPLFSLQDNVLPSMHILNDHILQGACEPEFIVYPVERMFYWAKKRATEYSGKGPGFVDEACAEKELDRDCYRFIVNLACDVHQKSQYKFPACSKSIVTRLAYTICDHCCLHLGIPVIPGKHVYSADRRAVTTAELRKFHIDSLEGTKNNANMSTGGNNPSQGDQNQPGPSGSRGTNAEPRLFPRGRALVDPDEIRNHLDSIFQKMSLEGSDLDFMNDSDESLDDDSESESDNDDESSDDEVLPQGQPSVVDGAAGRSSNERTGGDEAGESSSEERSGFEQERRTYMENRPWSKRDGRDYDLAQHRENIRRQNIAAGFNDFFDLDYAVSHESHDETGLFYEMNFYSQSDDDEAARRQLERDRKYFPAVEEEIRQYRRAQNRRRSNLRNARRGARRVDRLREALEGGNFFAGGARGGEAAPSAAGASASAAGASASAAGASTSAAGASTSAAGASTSAAEASTSAAEASTSAAGASASAAGASTSAAAKKE